MGKEQVSKQIRLKEFRLKDEVLAYVRANLINKREKEKSLEGHLLVSQPVDPEFELLVVACVIQLLEGLLKGKFSTSLESDIARLSKARSGEVDLSVRAQTALLYRVSQKTLINKNITLFQILMRILVRLKSFDPLEIKKSYMMRVEDYETEDEVIVNRLRLRKYLRELFMNQKRLIKAATDAALKEKNIKLDG